MMSRNNDEIEDLTVGIFWESVVCGDIRHRPHVTGLCGAAAESGVSRL